jgi:hypothetical protein
MRRCEAVLHFRVLHSIKLMPPGNEHPRTQSSPQKHDESQALIRPLHACYGSSRVDLDALQADRMARGYSSALVAVAGTLAIVAWRKSSAAVSFSVAPL